MSRQKLQTLSTLVDWNTEVDLPRYSFVSMKAIAAKYKLPVAVTKASQALIFQHYLIEREMHTQIKWLTDRKLVAIKEEDDERVEELHDKIEQLKADLEHQKSLSVQAELDLDNANKMYATMSKRDAAKFEEIQKESERLLLEASKCNDELHAMSSASASASSKQMEQKQEEWAQHTQDLHDMEAKVSTLKGAPALNLVSSLPPPPQQQQQQDKLKVAGGADVEYHRRKAAAAVTSRPASARSRSKSRARSNKRSSTHKALLEDEEIKHSEGDDEDKNNSAVLKKMSYESAKSYIENKIQKHRTEMVQLSREVDMTFRGSQARNLLKMIDPEAHQVSKSSYWGK